LFCRANLALYAFFAKIGRMKVAWIARDEQKQEWCSFPGHTPEQRAVVQENWLTHPDSLTDQTLCIDLSFEEQPDHLGVLENFQQQGGIVVVAAQLKTCENLPTGFIRMNAWSGFLDKPCVELAGEATPAQEQLTLFFKSVGRTTEWVNDQIGFIAPRVIACVINEAYLALQEGVSTKDQIDTAMQLGTNYPHGPFAWAEKIGKKKIVALLTALSMDFPRYTPAPNFCEEVNAP
jgi:3-hydroxybutyryl-CoA dehydrogenase